MAWTKVVRDWTGTEWVIEAVTWMGWKWLGWVGGPNHLLVRSVCADQPLTDIDPTLHALLRYNASLHLQTLRDAWRLSMVVVSSLPHFHALRTIILLTE
jgi:hypothetical protein